MKTIYDGDCLLYFALPRKGEEQTLPQAIDNYISIKNYFRGQCFSESSIVCFSNGENFRKDEYPEYKLDRKDKELPPLLEELRDYVIQNDPESEVLVKGEADDLVLMKRYEIEDSITVSIDKDLMTYPGVYYNMRKKSSVNVTHQEAYDFMLYQFLAGDPGDHVKGIYRIGYITAEKLLKDIKDNEQRFFQVQKIWKSKFGDGWEEPFNETANLTFIRRREEDLTPLDFTTMTFGDLIHYVGFEIPRHKVTD